MWCISLLCKGQVCGASAYFAKAKYVVHQLYKGQVCGALAYFTKAKYVVHQFTLQRPSMFCISFAKTKYVVHQLTLQRPSMWCISLLCKDQVCGASAYFAKTKYVYLYLYTSWSISLFHVFNFCVTVFQMLLYLIIFRQFSRNFSGAKLFIVHSWNTIYKGVVCGVRMSFP